MKTNILLLLFAILIPAASFADDGVSVCSYVSYSSDNWTYPDDLGIYSFKDGVRSVVFAGSKFTESDYTPTDRSATGGVYAEGHYKYVQATSGRYGTIASTAWVDFDFQTGTFTRQEITGNASNILANISYTEDYDPMTNTIYGYYQSSDYSTCSFGKRNVESGEVNVIATKSVSERLVTIAVDGSGQLWGIDYDARLVKVDKTTGDATPIAQISLTGSPSGMCFDRDTNKLYLLMSQQLFEVNVSTGELTKLWGLEGGYSLQGLFFKTAVADSKAPAAVKNLTVDFGSAGSLSGTLKFTAPSTTFDGLTPLSGNVSVRISFGGEEEIVSVAAGTEYTYNKTVAEAGQYDINVCPFNESGNGPKRVASIYIGEDLPAAVGNLTLGKKDGKASLSWDAPATGLHEGGYLATDKITYTVKRILTDGSETVAETGIKGTAYTDNTFNPGALCGVTYEVTACCDGKEGGSAKSGKIILGPAYIPAVTLIHPSSTDLDLFTQICNDKNSGYWRYYDPHPDLTAIYFEGSNRNSNTDNWLISPPVHMEKGKVYRIFWTSCNRSTPAWYPETMEVRIGKDATAEALLDGYVLQESFILQQDKADGIFEKNFIPAETADYNIGFHDITTQYNGNGLLIWNLSVSEGLADGVPEHPVVTSSAAHEKGELKVDITFTVPSLTNTGAELTGDKALTAVRILDSENNEVYKLTDVTAGATVTANDIVAVQGDNTFRIVAENGVGVGLPAEVTVYAGVGLPAVEGDPVFTIEDGNAVLTWSKCSDTSADGKYVDVDKVDYQICVPGDDGWQEIATTKGTRYVIPATLLDIEAGEQGIMYFGIRPSNAAGNGKIAQSNDMLAGQPYTTPWRESFREGVTESYMLLTDYPPYSNVVWGISDFASDNDGGSLMLKPDESYGGQTVSCSVVFGKVDIRKLSNPVLKFDAYVPPGNSQIDVKMATNSDYSQKTQVASYSFGSSPEKGWKTFTTDISDYLPADNVMAVLAGTTTTETLYIDNIRVTDYVDKNIALTDITAPAKIYSGATANVSVTLTNEGKNTLRNFDVQLYDGDSLLGTCHGDEIAADARQTCEFTVSGNNDSNDFIRLNARIVSEEDQLEADNSLEGPSIRIVKADLAAPTELTGEISDGDILTLSWTAPADKSSEPVDVEDSFEEVPSWSIKDFGEWTMIDADAAPTSYLSGYTWKNSGRPHAAIIFNPAEAGLARMLPAYDGKQYLASFVAEGGCDDWLISPKLSGNAQTFSFYVAQLFRDWSVNDEIFEILISRSTPDISSFEKVGDTYTVNAVSPSWEQVEIDIEDDVKYLAIHHITNGGTAMFIDNARYQMAPLPIEYSFEGYNIYCNDALVNSRPVTATSFETAVTDKSARYTVRAVYSIGLSDPSNEFDISPLGIGAPATDRSGNNGELYDLLGRRVVKPVPGTIVVKKGGKSLVK